MGDTVKQTGKYIHLLQPLRELADNWSIDIAHELEEYLEELETITFTFEGGTEVFNFAEAALVIQNSASVYSKKVESLMELVVQALSCIQKKPKAAHKKEEEEVEEETQFLSLDDIPEATNIDLKDSDDNLNDPSQASVIRNPILLHLKLCTGTSAVSGRTEDAAGGSNLGDFQMCGLMMHQTGALVLDDTWAPKEMQAPYSVRKPPPLSRLVLDSDKPSQIPSEAPASPSVLPSSDPFSTDGGDISDDDNPPEIQPATPTELNAVEVPNNPSVEPEKNSIKEAEPMKSDAVMNLSNSFDASIAIPPAIPPLAGSNVETFESHKAQEKETATRKAQEQAQSRREMVKLKKLMHKEDFVCEEWDLLDPYDDSGASANKPFVKGITYRIPPCLSKKKGRGTASAASTARRENVGIGSGKGRTTKQGTFFSEFEYLYKAALKRRNQKRRGAKPISESNLVISTEESNPDGDLSGAELDSSVNAENAEQGEPPSVSVTVTDSGGVIISQAPGRPETDPDEDDFDNNNGIDEAPSPENTSDPPLTEIPEADPGTLMVDNFYQSYEQLAKERLGRVLDTAQQEAELRKRVNDWQDYLLPILEMQAKREDYNIHTYCKRLLDTFLECGGSIGGPSLSFQSLCNATSSEGIAEQWQVTRLFLSMLMLLKSENFKMTNKGSLELSLLSLEPLYEIEKKEEETTTPEPPRQKQTKPRKRKGKKDQDS
ncbi:Condensin-2 complex subunit H2 [Pelomyxa schiedti]|nr:Condensin-2 complex subunit H2 [Pelomyxa schiedti]